LIQSLTQQRLIQQSPILSQRIRLLVHQPARHQLAALHHKLLALPTPAKLEAPTHPKPAVPILPKLKAEAKRLEAPILLSPKPKLEALTAKRPEVPKPVLLLVPKLEALKALLPLKLDLKLAQLANLPLDLKAPPKVLPKLEVVQDLDLDLEVDQDLVLAQEVVPAQDLALAADLKLVQIKSFLYRGFAPSYLFI